MPLKPWTVLSSETVATTRVFELRRDVARSPRTGVERDFSRLVSAPWVNMVPLTPQGQVVLVRQWRHGVRRFTLEIPGGLVEAGEDPAAAAAREVREETGYAGEPPRRLGVVDPNPAIHDTLCHTFLIEGCRRVGEPRPDEAEDIEVVLRPLREIPELIRRGEIAHALVICAFWWLRQERPDLLPA